MGQRIAGVAYLNVAGTQYPLRGNFIVSPSPVERKGISGQDRVHGYQEMPRVPFISGDVSLVPELSVDDLNAITDATVQADLANGKSYVLRGAWCTSALELHTGDGQVAVKFEGISCIET